MSTAAIQIVVAASGTEFPVFFHWASRLRQHSSSYSKPTYENTLIKGSRLPVGIAGRCDTLYAWCTDRDQAAPSAQYFADASLAPESKPADRQSPKCSCLPVGNVHVICISTPSCTDRDKAAASPRSCRRILLARIKNRPP